jgi:serine/threonine-protein kinase RsbW
MAQPLECTLPVTPALTRAAHSRLEEFAGTAALPRKVVFAADTALEELLQNVLDHSDAREVRLRFAVEGGEFQVDLADDGRPFNPLLTSEPDITAPLAERRVGGLGVFMARKMMDRVGYELHEGRNRIQLAKSLG